MKDVLRVLARPRWLLYLALAVVFGVVTFNLGLWQLHRHEGKVERRDLVEAHYTQDPRPLVEVLPRGEVLPKDDTWSRVRVSGTYAADDQLLVRNRPHEGTFGYEVLVPLVLDDGQVVLVDRGWVPNARTAAEVPDVPAPPQGEVEVTGWLQPSEPDLGRDLPAGQVASIDLPRIAAGLGKEVVGAYVVLGEEEPGASPAPALLGAPDTGLGSHFAYALQWWLSVPVGLILVVVMARREAQDQAIARGEGQAPDGGTRAARPGTVPRSARPRKPRIWDTDDEDDDLPPL